MDWEELHRANRALRMLIQFNQSLVRATQEMDLLHAICRLMVETGGYRLAWIGYAEQDERKSVRPVAQAGYEGGYLDTLDITWADSERGRGPTGTAILTGKPCLVTNMQADPDFAPWCTEAAGLGSASSIALPISVEGHTLGALTLYTDEPDAFDTQEVEWLAELAVCLAFGILTCRLRAERDQAEEALQQSVKELGALNTLSGRINTSLSLDHVVQVALEETVACIAPDLAMLYLRQGDRLHLQGVYPHSLEFEGPGIKRVGECLCGLAVSQGEPIYSTNIHTDARCTLEECKKAGIRSFAASPLLTGDRVLGVLGVASTVERDFDRQATFLEALAGGIAVGLQNVLLHQQAQQHATELEREIAERVRAEQGLLRLAQQVVSTQEEERQRVSRELHDEAGQALTALKISLELIQSDLPARFALLYQRLGEAIDLTDTTIEQIRSLVQNLRPPALDAVGLNAALEGFCRDFAQRTHLSVSYAGVELSSLPDAVSISLYRFLQETLTNVARHAGPCQVKVMLLQDAEAVSLSVEDDGCGFDPEALSPTLGQPVGMGLLGMQERLGLLGGRLEIISQPGYGTRMVAYVPWSEIG